MQSMNRWMGFDTKMGIKDWAKQIKRNEPKNINKMSPKINFKKVNKQIKRKGEVNLKVYILQP